MASNLILKNIYFGKTDAKNELNENTPEQRKNFKDTFLLPAQFNLSDFVEGKKYFIYGLKGTGKTAFLRYLSIYIEDDLKNHTSFVLFKTNFDEADKQHFDKYANVVVSQSSFDGTDNNNDFELAWKWFFFRHILDQLESKDLQLFEVDDNWKKFKRHMKAVRIDPSKSGLAKYLPIIEKGVVELKAASVKLGLDFIFSQKNETRVEFAQIVKVAEKYFESLTPVGKNFYIFLDELELAFQEAADIYGRNSHLIRDLIVVAAKINALCRKKSYPIYIISSIRSEVLSTVFSSGKEINKEIEDFGLLIYWHQAGGGLLEHPLIEMAIKRLRFAEQEHRHLTNLELWKKFFPEPIQGKAPERYILDNTWYRPRDIVRLFTTAQQMFPDSVSFSHKVFDGIRKKYSTSSWVEATEELRAKYSVDEIEAIRQLFCGWKPRFTFEQFAERIKNL